MSALTAWPSVTLSLAKVCFISQQAEHGKAKCSLCGVMTFQSLLGYLAHP